MDYALLHFNLFTLFPEEIRLKIWKESFPKPRIIDLKFANSEGFSYVFSLASGCGSDGPWHWTTNSRLSLPLLQVNHEARRTTLELYKPTTIRQENALRSGATYIDFARDTIYRSCIFPDRLFKFDEAYNIMVSNTSTWSCNITRLAIGFAVLQPRRYLLRGEWLGTFVFPSAKARKHALRVLLVACTHFPAVQNLLLAIDGRETQFGGSTEIVDSSKLPVDIRHHDGREAALRALSIVAGSLRSQRPDVNLPEVKLVLFTNGEDTASWERHWSYYDSSYSVARPGSRLFRSFGDISDEDSDSDEAS